MFWNHRSSLHWLPSQHKRPRWNQSCNHHMYCQCWFLRSCGQRCQPMQCWILLSIRSDYTDTVPNQFILFSSVFHCNALSLQHKQPSPVHCHFGVHGECWLLRDRRDGAIHVHRWILLSSKIHLSNSMSSKRILPSAILFAIGMPIKHKQSSTVHSHHSLRSQCWILWICWNGCNTVYSWLLLSC